MIRKISYAWTIICTLLLFGCQTHQSVAPEVSGVSIEDQGRLDLPQIDTTEKRNTIGPTLSTDESEGLKKVTVSERALIGALVLGPGLYNVAGHVAVLSQLERLQPRARIITGVGLGAWIAALYAFGQTPQLIEWKLFKFYSESGELEAFSGPWKKLLADKMFEDLKSVDISEAKMILLVPVYNKQTQKIEYLKRGNLQAALMANVTTFSESKGDTSTPVEWGYFKRSAISDMGADYIIGIDVLGEDVRFSKPNDYLMGIFGRLIGFRERAEVDFDFLVKLPWKGPLDSTQTLSLNMLGARQAIEAKRPELQGLINSLSAKASETE